MMSWPSPLQLAGLGRTPKSDIGRELVFVAMITTSNRLGAVAATDALVRTGAAPRSDIWSRSLAWSKYRIRRLSTPGYIMLLLL